MRLVSCLLSERSVRLSIECVAQHFNTAPLSQWLTPIISHGVLTSAGKCPPRPIGRPILVLVPVPLAKPAPERRGFVIEAIAERATPRVGKPAGRGRERTTMGRWCRVLDRGIESPICQGLLSIIPQASLATDYTHRDHSFVRFVLSLLSLMTRAQ